ncbi:hypothetical protein BOTBODRAFT_122382, partial [Botryobasidium botryosum FD-172 SS1]
MDAKNDAGTVSMYNGIRAAYPQLCIRSFYKTRQRLRNLAGLKARPYPVCPNGCHHAFTRAEDIARARDAGCFKCHGDVFMTRGKERVPILTYDYLPLMPRIKAMWGNASVAEKLQTYCSQYAANKSDDDIEDVFDCAHYEELCQTCAVYKGVDLGHNHFHRDTDIALGLWADGFQLFKKSGHDC